MKPGTLSAVALLAPICLAAPVLAENPAPITEEQEIHHKYPGLPQTPEAANYDYSILPVLLRQNQDNPRAKQASESVSLARERETDEQTPEFQDLRQGLQEVPGENQDNGGAEAADESVSPATAQKTQEQIQELQQRLQGLETVPLQQIYLGTPGSSSNTPTAFGGSWGNVGVGVSYQERTRYTEKSDGTAGISVSFGNPVTSVGLDVGVTALDLSDYGDRGSFNFKLHRVLPNDFAVAVGLENALVWGFTDADTSGYGVVSKKLRLQESSRKPFSRVNLSLGVGNGRFRSEDDVNDGNGGINVFGSAAIQVVEPVGVFTEWTGQDLNIGASVVPFRNLPLVITPTLSDITGNAGDGTRFTIGVGYGVSLF